MQHFERSDKDYNFVTLWLINICHIYLNIYEEEKPCECYKHDHEGLELHPEQEQHGWDPVLANTCHHIHQATQYLQLG